MPNNPTDRAARKSVKFRPPGVGRGVLPRDGRRRPHRATTRYSDEEWGPISDAARDARISPSTFVALAAITASTADEPEAFIARRREAIAALMKATRQAARTAVALRELDPDGAGCGDELAAAIDAASRVLEQLDDAAQRIARTYR